MLCPSRVQNTHYRRRAARRRRDSGSRPRLVDQLLPGHSSRWISRAKWWFQPAAQDRGARCSAWASNHSFSHSSPRAASQLAPRPPSPPSLWPRLTRRHPRKATNFGFSPWPRAPATHSGPRWIAPRASSSGHDTTGASPNSAAGAASCARIHASEQTPKQFSARIHRRKVLASMSGPRIHRPKVLASMSGPRIHRRKSPPGHFRCPNSQAEGTREYVRPPNSQAEGYSRVCPAPEFTGRRYSRVCPAPEFTGRRYSRVCPAPEFTPQTTQTYRASQRLRALDGGPSLSELAVEDIARCRPDASAGCREPGASDEDSAPGVERWRRTENGSAPALIAERLGAGRRQLVMSR
jgi:hypothetical protein